MPNALTQMAEMRATPRNRLLGLLADYTKQANDFATMNDPRYADKRQNQTLGLLADAVSLGSVAKTLDRLSYGEPLTNAGKANVPFLRPETADVAMMAPLSPRNALAMMGMGMDTGAAKAIFAGIGAKTADKAALAQAEKMAAKGADPKAIWRDTGWFKGGDGKWRFEIDDSGAALKRSYTSNPDHYADLLHEAEARTDGVPLGSALSHPQAFAAYPTAGPLRFKVGGTEGGSFDGKTIRVSDPFAAKSGSPAANPDSTTLHELQHYAQEREGFANGGSIKEFMRDSIPLAINNKRLIDDIQNTGALDFGSFYDGKPFADLGTAATAYAKAKGISQEQAENAALAFWNYGGEAGGLKGVQDRMARAQSVLDDAFTSPEDKYRRLAGEAEARAVQSRMNMNQQQRRATFPLDSYDVPVNSLIYR